MVCALFSSKKVQLSKLHQKRYNFVADGRNTSMVVTLSIFRNCKNLASYYQNPEIFENWHPGFDDCIGTNIKTDVCNEDPSLGTIMLIRSYVESQVIRRKFMSSVLNLKCCIALVTFEWP